MDQELIDWLNTHTFPEEEKYGDLAYAQKAYAIFLDDLLHSATTRACVFGTCHKDATLWLMEQMEAEGLAGYVGKVNMDRNSPAGLCEESPEASCYGDAYRMHGLFGGSCPTIMAHCVYSGEEEIRMMKEQGVFIAHCPESNTNLASGIAPARKYMELGMQMGLGTDVAAGSSLSMFRAMAMAVQCSKLRWRLVDQSQAPLTATEVFHLATKGGGAFFGKAGSLERLICLDGDASVDAKYIKGKQVI